MDRKDKTPKNRGYLYTVGLVLLLIPLVLLITFYTQTSKTTIENTVGRVRCDELYYFVQDVRYDMERAMQIFGKRAAAYAINQTGPNQTFENYTYVPCDAFNYVRNGSEAAIAELVYCGTLNGTPVPNMVNHTIPVWVNRINDAAKELHYNVTINVNNLSVAMYDAWRFAITIDTNFTIHDSSGLCYYIGDEFEIQALTNITGLLDPLYRMYSDTDKPITQCPLNVTLDNVAGCSNCTKGTGKCTDFGTGTGSGNVVFYSDVTKSLPPGDDLGDYCSNTPNINDLIIVFDQAFGSCSNKKQTNCFNASDSDHMAGYIDYATNVNVASCNITIPWIRATGSLDNETSGHQRPLFCGANPDVYITDGMCVLIKNKDNCNLHQVIISFDSSLLNTTCYRLSNVSTYPDNVSIYSDCSQNYGNGPSFFDRLDGRLTTTPYYADKAIRTPYIGLETIVSPINELDAETSPLGPLYQNASWIDYLYWQNISGCPVRDMCQSGDYPFRLDCQHAHYYLLSIDCQNGTDIDASSESPRSRITLPVTGTNITAGYFDINGTASDCDGNVTSIRIDISIKRNETYLLHFTRTLNCTAGDDCICASSNCNWNLTYTSSENNIYFIHSIATDNTGVEESSTRETIVFFNGSSGDKSPPSTPVIEGPKDNYCDTTTTPLFEWSDATDASGIYRYQIQVDQDGDWVGLDINDYSYTSSYTPPEGIAKKSFVWRVRAQDNAGNWGAWSSTESFCLKNNCKHGC